MNEPTAEELRRYRDFASATARRAGALIRDNLRSRKTIRSKGADMDLVTETDVAAERLIAEEIRRTFPGHSILGEEGAGTHDAGGDYQWIVDPVDGTTNFAHSHLIVGCSIGLAFRGQAVAGCVYCAPLEEEFLAAKGLGATLNGEPVRVSDVPELSKALLATGFPYDSRERVDHYLSFWRPFILKAHGIRRLGSAALDLCWLAAGRLDGYWEENLKPWDTAAGVIVVQEAGGLVTDFSGGPYDLFGRETLASNGLIHREMSAILTGTGR